jgi:hypothetical protein
MVLGRTPSVAPISALLRELYTQQAMVNSSRGL